MSASGALETLCFAYWTDPLCVWAYVARDKFEAVRRTSTLSLLPLHRVVCVFGDVGERFATGSWSEEGPRGRAAKTADVARRFGKEGVSGQVWVDDAPASSWAPASAIKAAFTAESAGELPAGAGERYQWELRRAFFEGNRNTARRGVQLEVAEHCEIDRVPLEARLDDGRALAAVCKDQEERMRVGVRGSPTYVFDGAREMLYGNVPLELIEATIACLSRDGAPGRSPC